MLALWHADGTPLASLAGLDVWRTLISAVPGRPRCGARPVQPFGREKACGGYLPDLTTAGARRVVYGLHLVAFTVWSMSMKGNEMNTSTKIRLGVVAGLVIMAVIWILQNGGAVETKFLFFTVIMPKTVMLAITLLAGIATGLLLAWALSGRCWKRTEKPASAPDKQ